MLRNGDILLFRAEEDLVSSIIAWGTNSPYSHVAVCVSSEMNLAIEAITRGGVRARDIRGIPRKYDVFRVRPEYSYDLAGTVSTLVACLNNRYDYAGVLYLGLLKLLAKIGLPVKETANRWQKDRDYFCSELCYEAFFSGGLDIVPDIPQAEITSPADIARSGVLEKIGPVGGGADITLEEKEACHG